MMKSKILILIFLMFFTGCTTVEYVEIPLPDVDFVRPEKPVLENVDGEVPESVTVNTFRLMSYAEQLELCVDNWERFYMELKESEH